MLAGVSWFHRHVTIKSPWGVFISSLNLNNRLVHAAQSWLGQTWLCFLSSLPPLYLRSQLPLPRFSLFCSLSLNTINISAVICLAGLALRSLLFWSQLTCSWKSSSLWKLLVYTAWQPGSTCSWVPLKINNVVQTAMVGLHKQLWWWGPHTQHHSSVRSGDTEPLTLLYLLLFFWKLSGVKAACMQMH